VIAVWLFIAPPPAEPAPPDDDAAEAGTLAADRRTIVVTGTRSARTLAETPVATTVVRRK
jgi:hypothetical protein